MQLEVTVYLRCNVVGCSAHGFALVCSRARLKWEKRMRRKLRELVADQKVFGRLPKGALDGFIKWDGEKKPHLPWYPAAWINKPC